MRWPRARIVITGGKRHALGGTFFEPTVLVNANAGDAPRRRGDLRPSRAAFPLRDEAEAIAFANSTPNSGLLPISIPATLAASGALRRSWSSASSA